MREKEEDLGETCHSLGDALDKLFIPPEQFTHPMTLGTPDRPPKIKR